MLNKVSVWFLVRPSQIYRTPLSVMLQLVSSNLSNVLLILNMVDKLLVSSSVIVTLINDNALRVVLVKRASLICLIPPVSEEECSHSIFIVLLVFSISDNIDTHLLSNEVLNI